MLVQRLARIAPRFIRYVADADDSDELRLKKTIGVCLAIAGIWSFGVYGLLYISFGESAAGWLALSTIPIWIVWLGSYGLFRRFEVHMHAGYLVAVSSLVCIHYLLGGFSSSGMVILWLLTFPITAVITNTIKDGLIWATIVAATIVVAGFTDRRFSHPNAFPPALLDTLTTMNLLMVAAWVMAVVVYFVWRMQESGRMISQLLHNVFPQAVIPRLKAGENPIADGFADVTVLFADIVGYTALAERLGPRRTVLMLNDLFRRFDQAAEKFGVEKIETVGDGYLAVAGALDPRDDHPDAVAALAFAMIEASRQVPASPREHVQVRVGIHTGPVFGGVVGEHRFHYAIFGETVNVASRIQSHSQPGQVLTSESTFKRICDSWRLEECASLDLKGHGPMKTYWLRGPRDRAGLQDQARQAAPT